MERQIKLQKETITTAQKPIIFGKDDTLTLNFLSDYDLSDALISISNGNKQKSYKLESVKIDVPQEFMFSGWLRIGIIKFLDGEIVKKWQIIPIKLIESNPEVMPEETIQAHDEEIKALKDDKADKAETLAMLEALTIRLNDLAEKHNKLTEIVKLIKES